ncbi:MAG: SoxR reducing system RseC family protein [Nitrospirota bacterium]|nr:SoxR reducing system RseC family protein [Nitrospirota bacterium]
MKPSIPDTGTVIRLEGGYAVVRMKHEGSCYKCGAAAMGLCKGGLMQELTVMNPKNARVGDTVKIGLVKRVQYKGFVLAYVVPALALLLGIAAGHLLGSYAGLPFLEILSGFLVMIAVSFFSFRRLKMLDASHSIEIVQVISDPWIPDGQWMVRQ